MLTEKQKQTQARFRERHRKRLAEESAERQRIRRLDPVIRARINAQCLASHARHRGKRLKEMSTYGKTRYAIDPLFRLLKNLNHRVNDFEVRDKQKSALALIGCDLDWVIAWLEVQFKPGMSWENYGLVWHVDHKRPCNTFDLNDPVQQRQCFHWSNLQPLFAQENLTKKKTTHHA